MWWFESNLYFANKELIRRLLQICFPPSDRLPPLLVHPFMFILASPVLCTSTFKANQVLGPPVNHIRVSCCSFRCLSALEPRKSKPVGTYSLRLSDQPLKIRLNFSIKTACYVVGKDIEQSKDQYKIFEKTCVEYNVPETKQGKDQEPRGFAHFKVRQHSLFGSRCLSSPLIR